MKILIAINNLKLGGIQKSLINLLSNIHDKFDITLVVFNDNDILLPHVPKDVQVITLDFPIKNLALSHDEIKNYGKIRFFVSFCLRGITKLGYKSQAMKYILKRTKTVEQQFDIAISYTQNPNDKNLYVGCNEFVLSKTKANVKISFLHADYLSYGGNTKYNKNLYLEFDKIATVSNACKEALIEAIPELMDRVSVINNCVNYQDIIKGMEELRIPYDSKKVNLVTVARLSSEKGINRVFPAIKILKKEGIGIHWYVVGEGDLRQQLEEEIKANDLQEEITLLGAQLNPYKYLKGADLFLLPSYHEAEPIVLKEAMAAGVPVLTTATVSAKEIVNEMFGYVCDNNDNAFTKSLIDIVKTSDYLIKKNNLKTYKPNNDKTISSFCELVNEKFS